MMNIVNKIMAMIFLTKLTVSHRVEVLNNVVLTLFFLLSVINIIMVIIRKLPVIIVDKKRTPLREETFPKLMY